MQTTEILRTEVKFRFIDYLKAAQIPYYEPSLTVCPHCGQHAQVVGDFLWNCPNCGSKGDVVDTPWKATASEKPPMPSSTFAGCWGSRFAASTPSQRRS